MALLTTTRIKIGDKQIRYYEKLSLVQELGSHHTLTLLCSLEDIITEATTMPGNSKQLLGEKVFVTIENTRFGDTMQSIEFKGIVTKITHPIDNYRGAVICIEASSMTILAEQGKKYTSHTDLDLADIATQTLQGIDADKLSYEIAPRDQSPIPYSVQYNESDFEYLARLAQYRNEWFYYDGKKIILGSPSTQTAEIKIDAHLKVFNFHFCPKPNTPLYISNDYHTGEPLQKDSSQITTSQEYFQKFVNDKAQQMYRKSNTVLATNLPHNTHMISSFEQKVTEHAQAVSASQVTFSGESDHTGVQLGTIMHVQHQGKYRVTKVRHTNTHDGDYENTFEAIDASIDVYPKMDMNAVPQAVPQCAIVTDNNDPDGLGRVKVRCFWQTDGQTTPWLRLLLPYAGLERGFHFLPEIDDTVLLGFEGNNAERPYVQGSFRTMITKPHETLQNENNDKKAIEGRMGLALIFDDNEQHPKLKITDNENIEIVIDKQAKKLYISSLEDIEITGKNVKISAQENIQLESQNQTIAANTVKIAATQKVDVISNGKTQIKGSTVEHFIGSGAQSPTHNIPMEARVSSNSPAPQNNSPQQTDSENEEEKREGSIDTVTLYDENGRETDVLDKAANVRVATTDMNNQYAHIVLQDPDTQKDIDLGHYFVPEAAYTIEIPYTHHEEGLKEE